MPDRIPVSVEELAAALEQFMLDVRAGGVYDVHGSPLRAVNGTIDNPQLVADVLFATLSANAAHRELPATEARDVPPGVLLPRGRKLRNFICTSCGELFTTNCTDDDIECPTCDARRCPVCGGWFGGDHG